jgi:hypothetical protein
VPGAWIPRRSHNPFELVTYVCEGALAYEDSSGRSGVVRAGEFQRACGEAGVHRDERNASTTASARVFQISLRLPPGPVDHRYERKRFTTAERRGAWCLVASSHPGTNALRVHHDVRISSVILSPGHHVVQPLEIGDRAWLHVVAGHGVLHGTKLGPGDGVGVTQLPSLSFTARDQAELLLIRVAASSLASTSVTTNSEATAHARSSGRAGPEPEPGGSAWSPAWDRAVHSSRGGGADERTRGSGDGHGRP